jgi:hypothetical protein
LRREVIKHRFAFTGEFHECLNVVDALGYLTIEIEGLFKSSALLKNFAGTVLIGPEVGLSDLLLQVVELLLLGTGVKETSARPRFVISVV